jgi:hypothetical protein
LVNVPKSFRYVPKDCAGMCLRATADALGSTVEAEDWRDDMFSD